MANAFGIDYGAVARTIEDIKTARFNRGVKEEEQANLLATRSAMATYAQNPKDPSAFGKLVALNPQAATQIASAYEAMDAQARAKQQAQIDQIGTIAGSILQSSDPEKAYAEVRATLPPELLAKFPETYDRSFVEFYLAQATEVDQIYDRINKTADQATARANAVQDDATDHQQAIELANLNNENAMVRDVAASELNIAEEQAKAVANGKAAGIESADASLIYRQAAGMFGGTFDAQGNLQKLDPGLAERVQAVTARASQLFREGMDHAAAVKKAYEEIIGAGGVNTLANPAAGAAAPAGPAAPVAPMTYRPGDDPAGIL